MDYVCTYTPLPLQRAGFNGVVYLQYVYAWSVDVAGMHT